MPYLQRSQALHCYSETPITAGLGLTTHLRTLFFNGYLGSTNPDWPNDIVFGGSYRYPFLAAAEVLRLVSTSALDTALGTGAQAVYVEGLDASCNDISEVVSLAGTTPVLTSQSFYRVNHAEVRAAGSLGWNEGDVLVTRQAPTTDVLSGIPARRGHDQCGIYTVPAGHSLLVFSLNFSREVDADFSEHNHAIFTHSFRKPGESWKDQGTAILNSGTGHFPALVPAVVPECSDYALRVVFADKSTWFAAANARGILIRDSLII